MTVGAPLVRPLRVAPVAGGVAAIVGAAGLGALIGASLLSSEALLLAGGVVLCVGFVALLFVDLALGVAIWTALCFLTAAGGPSGLHGTDRIALALIVLVWLVRLAAPRSAARDALAAHGRIIAVIGLFLLWLTLSLAWADDPALVWSELRRWLLAALGFLIVLSTITTPRDVRRLLAAFFAGAVLSVLIGFADPSGFGSARYVSEALVDAGRLVGAEGDPNLLAAVLVPALGVGVGLLMVSRGTLRRLGLVAGMVVLAAGLLQTESRGGVIAAGASFVTALALLGGRRLRVLGFAVAVVVAALAWSAVLSHPVDRLTNPDVDAATAAGSGRADLWRVAWRIGTQQPVLGVGLHNFLDQARFHTQDSGELKSVELLVDQPVVAHNIYLELFAETGLIGLALFLAVAVGVPRHSWTASRRAVTRPQRDLATLSQAVVIAIVGFLASAIFLSNGMDQRLWILFAVAAVLTAMLDPARWTSGAPEPAALR